MLDSESGAHLLDKSIGPHVGDNPHYITTLQSTFGTIALHIFATSLFRLFRFVHPIMRTNSTAICTAKPTPVTVLPVPLSREMLLLAQLKLQQQTLRCSSYKLVSSRLLSLTKLLLIIASADDPMGCPLWTLGRHLSNQFTIQLLRQLISTSVDEANCVVPTALLLAASSKSVTCWPEGVEAQQDLGSEGLSGFPSAMA